MPSISLFKKRTIALSLLVGVFSSSISAQTLRPAARQEKNAVPAQQIGIAALYREPSAAAAAAKSPFESSALNVNSYEIKLAPEPEAWHLDGDKRINDRTGFPAAVYSADFQTASGSPEQRARQYLAANQELFGFSGGDLNNLRLHDVRTDGTGDAVVRLRQTYNGLAVNKNAEVTIHIDPNGVVDFVLNGFVYGIDLKDTTPAISSDEALAQVTNYLGVANAISRNETNELMVLRHGDTNALVYRVNLVMNEPTGEWEAFVDAKSGALLKLEDVALYYREKSKAPRTAQQNLLVSGTGNVFDPDPLSTSGMTYGGSYVDGSDANNAALTAELKNVALPDITLNGSTYSLTGPYAQIVDTEAPNKGLFTQSTPAFEYDRSADNFEAVMCYYHIDTAMRYLNETLALPVTPRQYAGGVKVDPSGLSGADNSHYTPGSGQLAFGEGGVDDAEDADVIWHELGHGLHDWYTSGGLSQVNGLSEGTGDYWAGSYSRFKGGWTSAQPAYSWTFNWDGHNPFWAGRLLNYSATYPGGLTGQIHTDGQIWATVNMKIWDDIGRQKSDKAFWKGLSMTNSSTNQNDAANAVYAASATLGYSVAERTAIRNRYVAAGYSMPAAPSSNVTVGGRVVSANGVPLANVKVTLTASNGTVRAGSTNNFGYFSFNEVVPGGNYTITVGSRRYTFSNPSQTVSVTDNVSNIVFTSVESTNLSEGK